MGKVDFSTAMAFIMSIISYTIGSAKAASITQSLQNITTSSQQEASPQAAKINETGN